MQDVSHVYEENDLLIASLQIDTKISQSPVCLKTYHMFYEENEGLSSSSSYNPANHNQPLPNEKNDKGS